MQVYVKKLRKRLYPALTAILGGSLFALLAFIPVFRNSILGYERKLGDSALYIPGKITPREDLIFLGIDDESNSQDHIGSDIVESSKALSFMKLRFPWDRRVYAETIDRLMTAGAKLVIIDLAFSEESTPEADQALAEAIDRHPGKVVLGCLLTPFSDEHSGYKIVDPHDLFFEIDNIPHVGFVNFRPQLEDGLLRTVRYSTTLTKENNIPSVKNEPVYESLSGATLKAAGKTPKYDEVQILYAAKDDLTKATEIYPPYSISSIFIPDQWEKRYESGKFFKDKIVLIGPAAPRLQDNHQTPVGQLFGPQVHLHAIAAGLDDHFVFRPFDGWKYGILYFGLAGALTIGLITLLVSRPLISIASGFLFVILAFVIAFLYARFGSTWISPVSFAASIILGATSGQTYDLVRERLERSRLHNQFRRFVSRDVADSLVNDPSIYQLAAKGRRRRVVVLFSDIRGFTSLSEEVPPEQLFAQLCEYLSAMVTIIFQHRGTLDKFIGDAILAHWGALEDGNDKDFSENAIAATKAMIVRLDELNLDWKKRDLPVLGIGVGLHIGEVLAGELGSQQRTEFGVIGDAVNLASRLEGMTKSFSSKWLCSGPLIESTSFKENARRIARIRVKGRSEPVDIWTDSPGEQANLDYQKILNSFEEGQFTDADELATKYIASYPEDHVAPHLQYHIRRMASSPPSNWDGVINFSEK